MDFLKRHLFFILCAATAAAGVALAVTGLGAMPKVADELEKAKLVYDGLANLQSRPVGAAMIEAQQARIDEIKRDSELALNTAKELYGYQPLVEGILPDGDNERRIQFRTSYAAAMQALFASLRSGEPPTPVDVEAMAQRREMEVFRETQLGLDSDSAPAARDATGPIYTAAGVLTKAGALDSAEARASIVKALGIYCYANPLDVKPPAGPSLQLHSAMRDSAQVVTPALADVWWAQIQYWLQKDVVEAVNSVNDEAAEQAKQRGEDRWVGIMPVKEVVAVRIYDAYIIEDDEIYAGSSGGGYAAPVPCGTANTAFTKSTSSSSYDVLQFSLRLIMDQRDVLRFVDRLTKDKFHTLLRMSYDAVPANRSMIGKIYGSEPTVNVVMDFETILIPSVFLPLVPEEVCDEYDHLNCPERKTDEEGG